MKPIKRIALLHDLCGVGKAALTNMLPVLSMMGVEPCPVPTMLLSTHTGGYGLPASYKVSGGYIRSCADHYRKENVLFDMIFIGYLGDAGIADAVRYFISQFPEVPVILDPIMGDHGKYYSNFDETYGQAVRSLLPFADLILPNLTESFLLAGEPWRKVDKYPEILEICGKLESMGGKNIIITSVPVDNLPKSIAVYENHALTCLANNEILEDYHGTGDVFDGMLTAEMLNGKSILESAKKAQEFVCHCIRESLKYDYPKREGLMLEKALQELYNI